MFTHLFTLNWKIFLRLLPKSYILPALAWKPENNEIINFKLLTNNFMWYNYVPKMSLTQNSLNCCKQQIIKPTHSEQMQVTAVCDQTQTQAHYNFKVLNILFP